MIMRLAPIGAFGQWRLPSVNTASAHCATGQLIICFYITCILFVVLVLGSIAKATGFSIFKFIRYIREELLIVLGLHLPSRRCAYARQDGETRLPQIVVGWSSRQATRLTLMAHRYT